MALQTSAVVNKSSGGNSELRHGTAGKVLEVKPNIEMLDCTYASSGELGRRLPPT